MRTLRNLFLTAATLLCCTAATWAQTTFENETGKLKFTVTDATNKYVSVAKGSSTPSGKVTIPQTVNYEDDEYTVTSIEADGFYNCTAITSVIIPEGVTTIGNWAFASCTKMTTITIPESVTTIGSQAFNYCDKLTSITIPKSVTSIGNSAFLDCGSLKSINVAEENTNYSSIAGVLFSKDEKTLMVYPGGKTGDYNIPEGVTSISSAAFYDCSNLKSINIPEGITNIEDYTFFRCSSLASATIPEGVTRIGRNAFYGCSRLTLLTIPGTVTNIGDNAFFNVKLIVNLSEVTNNSPWGAAAVAIVDNDFVYSDAEKTILAAYFGNGGDVEIPETVTTISASVFKNCTGLTSIIIPATVTSINTNSFSGCTNLTKVTINSNAIVSNNYTSSSNLNTLFGSQVTEYVLGENVTAIGYCAFNGCSSLASINIPDGVTSIGGNAFYGCTGLTSVTIPAAVTSIGSNVFDECSNLTKVTINSDAIASKKYSESNNLKNIFGAQVTEYVFGESVTAIGWYALYNCSGITSVTFSGTSQLETISFQSFTGCSSLASINIPDGVTSIGDYAFLGCAALESVTFPESITTIDGQAFNGCIGLTSVTIPSNVTTMGYSVFANCANLTKVTINSDAVASKTYDTNNSNLKNIFGTQVTEFVLGEDITAIGDYAFYGCSGLTSITIPENVTTIGEQAFRGCTNMASVTFSDASKLETIGEQAFQDCSNLTSVAIPEGVTSINSEAFYRCSALTLVTIPEGVKSISDYAFSSTGLTSVTIPESVESIGDGVFNNCTALTSVTIPESVKSIGDYSFSGTGLTSVTIPESVESIGNYAFSSCTNVTEFVFENATPPTFGTDVFYNTTCPIYVPNAAALRDYKQADNMSYYADRIQVKPIVVDGVKYKLQDDGTCTVLANDYSGDVVIPGSVDYNGVETTVTSISGDAFNNCSDLKSIIIPVGVTNIGDGAFSGCTGLTSVAIDCEANFNNASLYITKDGIRYNVLNKEIVTVVSNSYSGEIVIPETILAGNTFNVTAIESFAFSGCTGLKEITIPKSVTTIGSSAFSGCTNIAKVTINSNAITSKTYNTFSNLSKMFEGTEIEYVFGENITAIGDYAFYDCTNVKEYTFENAIAPTFGNHAFYNITCPIYVPTAAAITNYKQACGYPNLVQVRPIVVDGVKYQLQEDGTCIVLANDYSGDVVIRGSVDYNGVDATVTTISGDAFTGCSDLTSVVISDGVTLISDYAFSGCTGLSSVSISESVTSIGFAAFGNCSSLTSVTIPGNVTTIGSYAFQNCSSLASITISEGVTTINSDAFRGCTSLTEITIPESVTTIMQRVFDGCNSLETVYFNAKNCTKMGYDDYTFAFTGCTSVTTIIIGDNVETIPRTAFKNCTGLKTLTIPASVTTIGNYAFEGCNEIETLTFNSDAIGNNFNNNANLKTLNIGNSVTNISGYAFRNCTGLTSINIPEGVTSIGSNAFEGCTGLKSVTIPASVTTFGSNSSSSNPFAGCTGIETLTYNTDAVTWQFSDNPSLKTLNIGNAVTKIGGRAFENCTGLTSVVVPNSVTSIGGCAFYGCSGLTKITLPFVGGKPYTAEDTRQLPFGYIFGYTALNTNENSPYPGSTTIRSKYIGDEVNGYKLFIPSGLREVVITGSSYIQPYAFNNCSMLTSITIPASVTSVGKQAFRYTDSEVIFEGATPPSFGEYVFENSSSYSTCPIYVPTEEAVDAYKAAENMQSDYSDYRNRVMVSPYCKITVVANNSDYGTVSGGGTYNITTTPTITITATAAEHYRFVCWEEDGVTDNPRTVAVQPNATFTAVFAEHLLDSLAIENIVAPTCTVAGSYDSVVYCSVCRVELSRDVIDVPAAGHKADSVVFENVVAATRTAAGSYDSVVYCSVCRVELSRTTVNVPQILAESIKLASKPNKVEYKQGEKLDVKGGKITIGYTDKSTEDFEILAGWVSGFDSQKVGEQKLTVTFESVSSTLTTTFNVTVSKEDDNTAITDEAAEISIYAYNSTIVVEAVDALTGEIAVFDVNGRMVVKTLAAGSRTEIAMPRQGLYIVRVGAESKRVVVY